MNDPLDNPIDTMVPVLDPTMPAAGANPRFPEIAPEPIDPIFQVHRLNENGLKKAEIIAFGFNNLLRELKLLCLPPGADGSRNFSIVQTKLQEACFFAKRAMAGQKDNQQQ